MVTTTSTTVWTSSNLLTTQMEMWDIILLTIALVVLVAWIASVMFILRWGVLLILSGWRDDKTEPALKSIKYAMTWLVVIILSLFLFPKFAWLIGIDATNYSNPKLIFEEVKRVSDKVLKTNNNKYMDTSTTDIWTSELPDDFSDL